jgi:DNA polymerase (family 10)
MDAKPINPQIADRLREAADLLAGQQANPFRVAAYRRAADTIAALEEDLGALLERAGIEGVDALPGIGPALAAAIVEMVRTGRWAQLERLRGTVAPETLFQAVPGLGSELARRVHDALEVDTLEALEAAAHDGRRETVSGIGPRRAAAIRASLAAMLARTRPRPAGPRSEPPIALLLDVDREYRTKTAQDLLPKIAPRRFNPAAEAWLPVLHTERGAWRFTALFSNTARAHDLGRTRDWVVVFFHADTEPEGQRTVVTETHGPLIGRRVARGREADCRAYYEAAPAARAAAGSARDLPKPEPIR